MIRRSSRPCSFFAAWYSKFSERSPKLRAVVIACDRFACARGPSSSASSASSCSFCAAVNASAFSLAIQGAYRPADRSNCYLVPTGRNTAAR